MFHSSRYLFEQSIMGRKYRDTLADLVLKSFLPHCREGTYAHTDPHMHCNSTIGWHRMAHGSEFQKSR